MDWKNKKIIDKYWQAESSLAEEQQLKKAAADAMGSEKGKEGPYFDTLNSFSKLTVDASFEEELLKKISAQEKAKPRLFSYRTIRNIAASILLVTGAAYSVWVIQEQQQQKVIASELAFEEAKSALLLISSQLNKGTSSTYTIRKFSTTQQKLKK